MVDSVLVSIVMIFALLGGVAFMYIRFSNVRTAAEGVKLIGEFLIFFIYFVTVLVLGMGFMGA